MSNAERKSMPMMLCVTLATRHVNVTFSSPNFILTEVVPNWAMGEPFAAASRTELGVVRYGSCRQDLFRIEYAEPVSTNAVCVTPLSWMDTNGTNDKFAPTTPHGAAADVPLSLVDVVLCCVVLCDVKFVICVGCVVQCV